MKKFSDGDNRTSIVNFLLKNKFSCFLISHHRDSSGIKNFNNGKKLEINEQNVEQILFDRETVDLLIFAIKKDLNINSFDYFSKSL